jgi:hypothetical protein
MCGLERGKSSDDRCAWEPGVGRLKGWRVAEDEQRKQSRRWAQEEAGGRWMSRSSEDSGATEPDIRLGCVSCRDFEHHRE